MNREFAKCCRVFIFSKLKPNLDILPRCFSSQDKLRESDKLDNIENKKGEPHIFTKNDLERFMLAKDVRKQYVDGDYSSSELLPFMKIGARIRRGKDWEWQAQDDFEPPEGEIIEELKDSGWIRVQWDNGHINSYRMGAYNKYDLQLAPAGSMRHIEESDDEFIEEVKMDASDNLFDSNLFQCFLPMYYEKCFPFHLYHKWLSYGNDQYFSFRELCFITSTGKYHRYEAFRDMQEMKQKIIRKCPFAIHIGAVFSGRPTFIKHLPIEAQEKELVFDIDMSDYNDVRICCDKDNICHKCWKLMAVAVKILERSLRDDFGFKHILWVFSGRRGIHCWVCDAKARALTEKERKSIINYLAVSGNKKTNVEEHDPILQHVEKSGDIGMTHFESICIDQDIFVNKESLAKFMNLVTDVESKVALSRVLPKYKTNLEKWSVIREELSKKNVDVKGLKCKNVLKQIILDLIYPRLDANVTIPVNHLLKSPYSIHPKTGTVCVPIRTSNIDQFDPKKVPNLSQLKEQICEYDLNNKGNKLPDYKKTSLKESIEYFEEFLSSIKEDGTENRRDIET